MLSLKKNIILITILTAGFLLALFTVFFFFIMPAPKTTSSLLQELPRAYMLYDGLTINLDGSPEETFWLRDGFGQSTALAGASDGKGRLATSSFSLAFERWQARNITIDIGIDAQQMCRKLELKVNRHEVSSTNITGGYQELSLSLPDEDLASGENILAFELTGEGECAATVDYIRFRLGKSGIGGTPAVDQRLISGAKTDVLGTSSSCEMNFYLKALKKSRLSFTLGHDKEKDSESPGRLRIWCQGEATEGKLLWEGDFPAHGQKKLDLEPGNTSDEIILLSFYITPKPDSEDWLYLAKPELVFVEAAGKVTPQLAPLLMDKSKPRTIVLIFEDAMRRDMLPAYGNKFVQTPNLEEIAKSATIFENCYAPSNWTFPSFSSIFTSQPLTRTGAVRKIAMMVDSIPTLAGELNRNGWETVLLTSNFITGPRAGVSRGYKSVLELYNLIKHKPPITVREYLPVLNVYLAQVPPSNDVFITMHLMDTHEPYTVPDKYRSYYDGIYSQIEGEFPWLAGCPSGFTPEQIKDKVISICSAISYFDSVIPELIKTVANHRDPTNTIYILLSDHGEELCDHGGVGHGGTLYEEMIHIPLIVWGDGVKSGKSAGFVNSIDLMPTILEMAGVEVPSGLEGRSFAGQLSGDYSGQPRTIFSAMQKGLNSLKCAIDSPWKLIYTGDTPELYNLIDDPEETRNLCAEQQVVFGYMRGILWSWWRNIHAGGVAESNQQLVLSPQEIEILRGLGYVQK